MFQIELDDHDKFRYFTYILNGPEMIKKEKIISLIVVLYNNGNTFTSLFVDRNLYVVLNKMNHTA